MSGAKRDPSEQLNSRFTSTRGGVMTVEVGAITGELELRTRPTDSGFEARVRYAGARDLYTVSGSPVRTTQTHRKAHETILGGLTTPGRVGVNNEHPVDLTNT